MDVTCAGERRGGGPLGRGAAAKEHGSKVCTGEEDAWMDVHAGLAWDHVFGVGSCRKDACLVRRIS